MKFLEVHEVHDIHSYQIACCCLSQTGACFAVRMGDMFLISGLRHELVSNWASHAPPVGLLGKPEGEQFV